MSETLQAFVQACLNEAVRVLAPVLVAAVIGWVAFAIQKLRGAIGDQRWRAIEDAARYAVFTAEQLGISDQIAVSAENKKRVALNIAEKYLAARGIKIDLDVLADIIEGCVAESLNYDRIVADKTPASE